MRKVCEIQREDVVVDAESVLKIQREVTRTSKCRVTRRVRSAVVGCEPELRWARGEIRRRDGGGPINERGRASNRSRGPAPACHRSGPRGSVGMRCELGTEAWLDTNVIELSSTVQRGDDVSHPQLAGRDYLDTRSLDTRGTNVRLGPAPVRLPSRRRSSSVATSAGISSAAPLLPALSRELERAAEHAARASIAAGTSKGPRLRSPEDGPTARKSGAQSPSTSASGMAHVDGVHEAQGTAAGDRTRGDPATANPIATSRDHLRGGTDSMRCWAEGAGLGSPQQKASPVSVGKGTHNKGAAERGNFVVGGNAKETVRSVVTLARDRVQVGGISGGKALEGRGVNEYDASDSS
ncbi:hypothetical protein B0H14DRAFT_2605541 [Mycena olivaceomarginata]|nr:hypothetical protein B0H14DRAFT_2605541 [Mycena olivaceomarginata]